MRAAATPAEALGWLREGRLFDVAVLARYMPVMDGVILAGQIRRRCDAAAMPLRRLSSLGERAMAAEAKLFAADWTKPAKPAQRCGALAALFRTEPVTVRPVSAHPFVATALAKASRNAAVLLAEGNVVNQKVALLMLAKRSIAERGRQRAQAIAALKGRRYDRAMRDVPLPGRDGLEASRQIRVLWPERRDCLWIIALTANALHGDRELCLAAGMDDDIGRLRKSEERAAVRERAQTAWRPQG